MNKKGGVSKPGQNGSCYYLEVQHEIKGSCSLKNWWNGSPNPTENFMIDFSSEFGSRVGQELKSRKIIWLTTIGPDETPQPRPVWFLWAGTSILIYSQANAHKLRHLENNPKVALNLNTDESGEEVAVFLGEARLEPSVVPADKNPEYIEKYKDGIASLEMTPAEFAADYSIALRVMPAKLRGF